MQNLQEKENSKAEVKPQDEKKKESDAPVVEKSTKSILKPIQQEELKTSSGKKENKEPQAPIQATKTNEAFTGVIVEKAPVSTPKVEEKVDNNKICTIITTIGAGRTQESVFV